MSKIIKPRRQPDTLASYLELVEECASMLIKEAGPANVDGPWFRGVRDENQGLIPGAYWRTNVDETAILTEFQAQAPPLTSGNSFGPTVDMKDRWQTYFMMQHYGLPTRLLDWTENALVALYFSLADESAPAPSVWVLNPAELNGFSVADPYVFLPGGRGLTGSWLVPESGDASEGCWANRPRVFTWQAKTCSNQRPLAIYAPRRNPRLLAQSGTFTIHGSETQSLHLQAEKHERRFLARIRIRSKCREAMLASLQMCAISESRLFPELPYLSIQIKKHLGISP